MSHLSTMKTNLSNIILLEESLSILGIKWYREDLSHIVIPQKNGQDFGFFWNGKEFEFVGDEMFWVQPWSISSFLEKIQYQYIYKALELDLKARGLYDTSKITEQKVAFNNFSENKIILEEWR